MIQWEPATEDDVADFNCTENGEESCYLDVIEVEYDDGVFTGGARCLKHKQETELNHPSAQNS